MGRTIMNRWAVRQYVRLRNHLADHGQTSFEYLGIAVVIVVIIGALTTTDIGNAVKQGILDKIAAIVGP